ncbi:GNAT family N-acetyltransferase [Pseudomonas asuensis]|uniref:N-acetyltransferase n=1 Tax=Pseudomonas asuensis TaxID=1825787 RepID=A0ABQ2GNP2_9PSED|nr:GNAT family N-acetyltransferase [Pseudomonas asuensis]GGM03768.1 N-acetyltransferase [Pseudomonas asuensis]
MVDIKIEHLKAEHFPQYREGLGALLRDSVAGGASIGFLADLSNAEVDAYLEGIEQGISEGNLHLWVALLADRTVAGSVQLAPATKRNGLRRAEVQKLMVLRGARRHGIAHRLMITLENAARTSGRTLLHLDTLAGSDAEYLYQYLGYQRVGEIPDYAANPDGSYHPTALYYKQLRNLS